MSIKFNDFWSVGDIIAKVLYHIFVFNLTQLISPHYLVKHKSTKFVHNAKSVFRNLAALKSIYRARCQSEWGIGYNLLAQKLLSYIFWISHGGFLSLDRTAPAHRARDTVAFLERKVLDFIPPTLWPTNSPDLNPVDCIIKIDGNLTKF